MWVAILFSGFCTFSIAESSYLVSAPNLVGPGTTYGFTVSVSNANGVVNVQASLVSKTSQITITSTTATVINGNSVHMSLNIPKTLTSGHYTLNVKGHGGLSFTRQTDVTFRDSVVVLIQTDKAIYSPEQTVRFRVAAMRLDLKPYTGVFDVEIYDAKKTLIQQWMAVNSNDGVFAASFLINADPKLGQWKIKVSVKGRITEKGISVKRYILPKFNVNVIVPKSYILNSGPLTAQINASYTFGKPVLGTAVVQFIKYPGKIVITEEHVDLNGQGTVSLLASKVPSDAKDIVVVAQLGETTTGTTVIGSATVAIVKAFRLTFGPTRKSFSPGLPYTTFIKISSDVGSKVNPGDIISVKLSLTNVVVKRCKVFFPYDYRKITTSTKGHIITLGSDTSPRLTFTTPSTATKIDITVTLRGVSESLTIYADFTKHGKNLQIIPKGPDAQVGQSYAIDVKLSEVCNDKIIYQVISKGAEKLSGSVDCTGTTIPVSFQVTSDMAPKAHVLVYTIFSGEIVTDEIDLDVASSPSLQKIQLNFNLQTVKPGELVGLDIQGNPKSKVHLLAVDESVHILQSGYDISVADVLQQLQMFDSVPEGKSTDIITKRRILRPIIKKTVATPKVNDAQDIFQVSGINIMSDANLYDYDASRLSKLKTYCRDNRPIRRPTWGGGWGLRRIRLRFRKVMRVSNKLKGIATTTNIKVTQIDKKPPTTTANKINPMKHEYVREKFPETWIWESVYLGNDGTMTLNKIIPDTITTWRASAFAVQGGFGVTDAVAKITVFVPIFVDLILPFKVLRNEKFVVKVSIFNYQQHSVELMVKISHTADPSNRQSIGKEILAGSSGVLYFEFDARISGESTVDVTLLDSNTFSVLDRIKKKMHVKNEGIEQEYNKQHFISLSKGTPYSTTFNVTLPPGYVQGSKRVYVTVSGDLNAPTISGLGHLIKQPCGCGEQTIMYLAPNIFVVRYLETTKQLTQDFKQKAIKNMIYGRDNEMRWQRSDGSFSAWGNRDSSGSMWITAFVAMSFHQAKPYIHINENIFVQAVDWIIEYQNSDGSFREPGRVIHANMQGASTSSKTAFTAYVMVALLEIDDIPSLKSKISSAANKAKKFIENKASSVVENHALALVAYALKVVGSSRASFVFKKLEVKAIDRGQMRSWESDLWTSGSWRCPNPRARPVDIETTAYALLYYALDKDFINGMKVLRWLTSQRNPKGGFASTQDTIVSLHAMTEFSSLMFGSKSSPSKTTLNVDISTSNHQSTFTINDLNRLLLQHENLPDDTTSVDIEATGDGTALVDVVVVYNIVQSTDKPAYSISTNIKNESFDSITVTICSRRTKSGNSGMVVEEITLPSGFKADLTSIVSVNTLKQKEADLDKVVLYFDRVGSTKVCVDMKADRVDKVIQSQTYPVEIYDYYDPRNQGIGNYTSGLLKNIKLCDVCPDCRACQFDTSWG